MFQDLLGERARGAVSGKRARERARGAVSGKRARERARERCHFDYVCLRLGPGRVNLIAVAPT